MKKRNFMPWRFMLVLMALAVSITFMGTAYDAAVPWTGVV
jgi:hypothetical protein